MGESGGNLPDEETLCELGGNGVKWEGVEGPKKSVLQQSQSAQQSVR